MRRPALSVLTICLLATSIAARAQSPPKEAQEAKVTGSITGHVTAGMKPAQGVLLVLTRADYSPQQKAVAKATTDSDGRYKLTNIPHGRYRVVPLIPAMVVSEQADSWSPGKEVNIAAGEEIEGLDFKLERGGVITGRVTDGDGKPVIGEYVRIERAKQGTQKPASPVVSQYQFDTDDRGVYRAYGVPAGRYLVSIGEGKESVSIMMGKALHFLRAFHPGTTEESQAEVVEVTPGGEATGVDIMVGSPPKSYEVAGRVLDAETGQPVAGAALAYGKVVAGGKFMGGYGADGTKTDARGEFKLGNIAPGRYGVFAFPGGSAFSREPSPTYSDATQFEVIDSNLSGLEIKVHPGATISGVVSIEGVNNPIILAKLPELTLGINVKTPDLGAPNFSSSRVGADGSFRVTGLRPGRAEIRIADYPPPKGLSLLSVQRNGVDQPEGIEVGPGERIENVRVVITYGTGVVRGQVQVQNGVLPQGTRLVVLAHRVGGTAPRVGWAGVDALNHFLIEGLSTGEYELSLIVYPPSVTPIPELPPPATKRSVRVEDGAEVPVTLILDLSQKENGGAPQ